MVRRRLRFRLFFKGQRLRLRATGDKGSDGRDWMQMRAVQDPLPLRLQRHTHDKFDVSYMNLASSLLY